MSQWVNEVMDYAIDALIHERLCDSVFMLAEGEFAT